MTEMYLCPSYYDDNNILQDCECGKCEKAIATKKVKEFNEMIGREGLENLK